MKECSKSTKTELNNEWNINLLQKGSLDIYHTYSSEFFTGWNTFFDIVWSCAVLKISLLRWIFSLE